MRFNTVMNINHKFKILKNCLKIIFEIGLHIAPQIQADHLNFQLKFNLYPFYFYFSYAI